MKTVRIIIADDHPIVLTGLSMLIKAEADLELAGQAVSGHEALDLVGAVKPDIAIIDISLPGIDGIQIIRKLSGEYPDTGFIALTQYEDRAHFNQAIDAGARGYVLKRSAAIHLISAIRGVRVGGLYVDPAMTAHFFNQAARRPNQRLEMDSPVLTDREAEVLKLVAAGFTTRQIATRLDISASSIETYKTRASRKLSIRSRADIVRFASSQGWLAAI